METRPKAERRLSLSVAQRERPGRLVEAVKMKGKWKQSVFEPLAPLEEEYFSDSTKNTRLPFRASRAKIKYANTYRLESYNKFRDYLVRDKAQAILTNKLQQGNYDAVSSPSLCASISEEILTATKEMGFDRYKYVVSVLIVEKAGQAIHIIFILAVNLHISFQKNFTKKNESPVDSHKYTGRGGSGNHFYLDLLPEMVSVDVMFEGMLLQYAKVVASRWVWDVQRDSWVSAKYETETFIALALVMACYYE